MSNMKRLADKILKNIENPTLIEISDYTKDISGKNMIFIAVAAGEGLLVSIGLLDLRIAEHVPFMARKESLRNDFWQ